MPYTGPYECGFMQPHNPTTPQPHNPTTHDPQPHNPTTPQPTTHNPTTHNPQPHNPTTPQPTTHKNEHPKVDDLVSLTITMAKENHLAGKRSRNKIKALKAGKETLEDRLARGEPCRGVWSSGASAAPRGQLLGAGLSQFSSCSFLTGALERC